MLHWKAHVSAMTVPRKGSVSDSCPKHLEGGDGMIYFMSVSHRGWAELGLRPEAKLQFPYFG